MQEVAHHLQVHAHGISGSEKDAFARSAYNRYYYACFLLLRQSFAEMSANWSQMPHRSYPDVLGGAIKKRLSAERKIAKKSEDRDLEKKIDSALRAVPELRNIMIEANAVRVVADYEPGTLVQFASGQRFSLNSIEISRAHEWYSKVGTLVGIILSAWRQFNV